MPTFQVDELVAFGVRVFEAARAPTEVARVVSESLVKSNLVGHDSHGVIRIPEYLRAIKTGQIDPRAEPEVVQETSTIALLDGHWAFGQLVAWRGMALAIEKAQASGLVAVAMRCTNHVGRLGEWVLMAASEGLIAMAMCNGGRRPSVAPYGGSTRVFGTNPMAWAVPLRDGPPLLVDFATSVVAEGKLRIARNRGESIPKGMILDPQGQPSTDPNDFYAGGVLLPVGGHKGSGLSLIVEVLGGLLTGAGCPVFDDFKGGNGTFFLVLDPTRFRPANAFAADVERLCQAVKASPPMEGFSEVLLPGEPEAWIAEHRSAGIPVDDETWAQIVDAARQVGVQVDSVDGRLKY